MRGKEILLPGMRMIHYYRYISYTLTSAFYIIFGEYPISNKLAVVLFLGVAAVSLDHIYITHRDDLNLIKVMIIIETFGNIAILLPSGGINSPYIWYSLNAVLVSSYFLSRLFLYFNLLAYTVTLAFISFYLPQSSNLYFESFLLNNSNLILSYILIIIAINLLMVLALKINDERLKTEKINGELFKANKMLAESMDDFTLLYQNVNAFVNVSNKDRLGLIIAEYIQKITKAPFSFIYTRTDGGEFIFETNGEINQATKNILFTGINKNLNGILTADALSDTVIREQIAGRDIIMAAINSSNSFYGILGIEMNGANGEIIKNHNMDQIRMLASLSAVLFERCKMEEINQNLLVSEEQQRIANEIHDGVSQRLFYTSCKITNLAQRVINHKQTDLLAELQTIQESMTIAIKELRETIYSNSAKNTGMTSFEESIRKYICEITELNEANMDLKMKGSFEYIGYELKKAILRILGEACGNAIRHGKSKNIMIELSRDIETINLKIRDDGIGFNLYEKIRNSNLGLGIRNMKNLVFSFNGSIDINSQLYEGTSVSVLLPLVCQNKGDKVV